MEGGLCYFHANPDKAVELGRNGGRHRKHPYEFEFTSAANGANVVLAFVGATIREGFSNLVLSRREGVGLAPMSCGANPWDRLRTDSGARRGFYIGPSAGGPGRGLCAVLTGPTTASDN